MKPTPKRVIQSGAVLVILLLVTHRASPGFLSSVFEPSPLDAAQVEALRVEYPEMPRVVEPTVGVNPFDMQRSIKSYWHAYVLAEVVERLGESSRSLPLSAAEREQNLGFSAPVHPVIQVAEDYRLRILDILYQGDVLKEFDPDLTLSVGQEIEIRSCVSSENVCESPLPNVQPGRLFFIGVTILKQEFFAPSGYSFTSDGLYYVVDGTHVISAYPETEPHVYSGLSLPAFKRTIRAIRNTHTEMDDRVRALREADPNPTGT